MIPKIIHYIWLGENAIPANLTQYMKTWNKLRENGFEIQKWNEDNYTFEDVPESIREAYRLKKYAFVSDWMRLKILYEYGGVYFDTDVEVKKDISELLKTKLLLGFIYDASIGTAVIGAEQGEYIIGDILKLYETAQWSYNKENDTFMLSFDLLSSQYFKTNNDLFTGYFLERVPQFRLNGKEQHMNDVSIYPKEYFEGFSFDARHNYTIHHCYGSWHQKKGGSVKKYVKSLLEKMPLFWTLYDMKFRKEKNNKLPFTKEYMKHIEK